MSKCEFVYETELGPMFGTQQATLRCKTHNCTIIILAREHNKQVCLIGRIEALEQRIAQLERPTRGDLDELGNLLSLRRPPTTEGKS
jgi:hypothetical protein